MIGWVADVERATLDNDTFRTVLFIGEHTQLTVMRLGPGEDIGREAHPHLDQFLRIEQGSARVELGHSEAEIDETHEVEDDWAIIVPAGVWHNVVNTGSGDVKLYSLYSPPEHPDGTVHETKADAERAEHGSRDSRSGRGEASGGAGHLSAPLALELGLRRGLVRDRERDPVLLDDRVENLVVEERGSLRLEKDPGLLLFDDLVVLGG